MTLPTQGGIRTGVPIRTRAEQAARQAEQKKTHAHHPHHQRPHHTLQKQDNAVVKKHFSDAFETYKAR